MKEAKKPYKIYISTQTFEKLKQKASDLSIIGRGWLSKYVEKISNEPICFIDENLKTFLSAIDLKK